MNYFIKQKLINCVVDIFLTDSRTDNQRLPLNHRHKIYPNGTLTVTDVERAADEGKYTCTALGATSTSLSTSPSSTSQSSSTLSASKMHQLTVSEMNHPSPTSSSTVTSSATKSASSSFTLNVQVRPVIEPFVFPKSLHQGQRYTILCSVSKGDLPVTIKWYKDGRQISSSSGLHPEFGGIGVSAVTSFASNLVFDAIRPEHTGNYTCEARLVLYCMLFHVLRKEKQRETEKKMSKHSRHRGPFAFFFLARFFSSLLSSTALKICCQTAQCMLLYVTLLALVTYSNNLFLFTCGFFFSLSRHRFFILLLSRSSCASSFLSVSFVSVCPANGSGSL